MWLLASGFRAQVQPFRTGLPRLRELAAFGQIEIPAEPFTSGGRPGLANELLGGPRALATFPNAIGSTFLAAALGPTARLIELSLRMAGLSTRSRCSAVKGQRQQMKGHRWVQHNLFDGRVKRQRTIRLSTDSFKGLSDAGEGSSVRPKHLCS